jgi:hypothetical protein
VKRKGLNFASGGAAKFVPGGGKIGLSGDFGLWISDCPTSVLRTFAQVSNVPVGAQQ